MDVQAPAPIVVTGLTDRRAVRRMIEAGLRSARARLPVLEHDPRGADPPTESILAVVTPLGEREAEAPEGPVWSSCAAVAGAAQRAVLDADDDPCRRLGRALAVPITWTSRDPRNPLLLDHLDRGGDACVFEDGALRVCAGGTRHDIVDARSLPQLLGGAARRPLGDALCALGAAISLGLRLTEARASLAMLEGPRYVRRYGVQVLLDGLAEGGAARESVRSLRELPAERRLVWRAVGALNDDVDALADAAGADVVDGLTLRELLRELRPGDALLVLVDERDDEAGHLLDRYESGWDA